MANTSPTLNIEGLKDKIKKKGKAVFDIKENDVIGVYFSAHWCPPCRGFTPVLADYYKKVADAGKKLEIIFVSSDRDEASFNEYYDTMPWAALEFSERDIKAKLSDQFGIRGIPTLILFDKDGDIITADGRGTVAKDPNGEGFPYKHDKTQSVKT